MNTTILKLQRRVSREHELKRKQQEGFPRAKSWGGRTDARTERKHTKTVLRVFISR